MDTTPDDPAEILRPLLERFAAELVAKLVSRGMSEQAARQQVAAALAAAARQLWNRPLGD
jgi:hypothetical protein